MDYIYYEDLYTEGGHKKGIRCIDFPPTIVSTSEYPRYSHYHDAYEILYVYRGVFEVRIDGKNHMFYPGELVIIQPGEIHCTRTATKLREYICIQFLPEVLEFDRYLSAEIKRLVSEIGKNIGTERVFKKEWVDSTDIPQDIRSIASEWAERRPGYELMIRSKIRDIMSWLFRYWSENAEEYISDGQRTPADTEDFVDRVTKYLNEQYMTASEKEAAKVCGYSVSYFSKLFNHTFGQSFRDRLLKVRLDHAVKLLLTTDMNITSLSSAAGFSSVSYFIKRFRESYGMSPKKYISSPDSEHGKL